MEIVSLQFAGFVLLTLLVYYLLPGRWQNTFLLLASYYFYITWSWKYALALFLVTLFNYAFAFLVERERQRKPWLVWVGVVLNAAALLTFLFAEDITQLLQGWLQNALQGNFELAILLPVGFGYYIMESISYLLDIQMKIAKPSRNPGTFALYLAYFPKLISGPIERARKFLPLLESERTLDNEGLARSLMLILLGLVQNTVLAGLLSVLVPGTTLTRPQDFSAMQQVIGLLTFGFFLYNQFAGYTKIVRGVSGLFGIPLSKNFNYPFFSKDFSDFWKRWHISLSEWFRDYIYMRISRAFLRRNPSRKNVPNLLLPPVATMLASGLWHGARLHLILWGLLNGVFIVAENFINLFRKAAPSQQPPWWRALLGRGVVLALAFAAAIPFQLTLTESRAFAAYLRLNPWELPDLRPLAVMAISLALDWVSYRADDEFVYLRLPRGVQAAIAALAMLGVLIVYNLQNAPTTFIYP